jgi:hypothetical protein
MRERRRGRPQGAAVLILILLGGPLLAQDTASPSPGTEASEGGPTVSESSVGYIDPAIPANVVRLRYDTAYRNVTPTRGEFFYAETAPFGPGLAQPEGRVDFQDVTLYVEKLFGQRFSAFVEVPVRFANFQDNPNHHGLSDITAGVKFALIKQENVVATTQLRVYTPTGDEQLGLGTGHVSLEPAFLLYLRLSDRLASESEVRYWQSIDGTSRTAGALVRYGTGLRYDLYRSCNFKVSPVVELVGWTFTDGGKTPPTPDGTSTMSLSAAGDTIVNAKVGVRFKFSDQADIYVGYGRALTGEVHYKDMARFELRLLY